MLFALLVTGLLASVALAADAGTKTVHTVSGLLLPPVVNGAKAGLSGGHHQSYGSVQGQQQSQPVSFVAPQFEPNVVVHQPEVPFPQQGYFYGVPQQFSPVVPNRRVVQFVPYFNGFVQAPQPQVFDVGSYSSPVPFLFGSSPGPAFYRKVNTVVPQVQHGQQTLYQFVQPLQHDSIEQHVQEQAVHQPTVTKLEATSVSDSTGESVQVLASSTSTTSQVSTSSKAVEQKTQVVNDF